MRTAQFGPILFSSLTLFPKVRLIKTAGGDVLNTSLYEWQAMPICLMLFVHLARAAASRTFCTAGNST